MTITTASFLAVPQLALQKLLSIRLGLLGPRLEQLPLVQSSVSVKPRVVFAIVPRDGILELGQQAYSATDRMGCSIPQPTSCY